MNLIKHDAIITGTVDYFKPSGQRSGTPLPSSAGHGEGELSSKTLEIDERRGNTSLKGGRIPLILHLDIINRVCSKALFREV